MGRLGVVVGLMAVAGAGAVAAPSAAALDAEPVRSVSVSGSGVGMYPGFDASVDRYAVTHGAAAAGTVVVRASTSDPAGEVLVDGRPLTGGQTTVTGLTPGEEVSVIFDDARGTDGYALFYLPDDFPTLEQTVRRSGSTVGLVGLTLTEWGQPTPNFEAVVDRHGVPVFARTVHAAGDLKMAANGSFTVGRIPGDGTGKSLVEYDAAFREVADYRTVGLDDTDTHDSVLLPDGHVILLAYVDNPTTGRTDSVIQELDERGRVVLQWSTAGLEDETVTPGQDDYAHINALDVTDDGDLLVSLRNFSSVFKIARRAHDGFAPGDVVWRLGGRYSDFTFLDDPHPGGPCAQHSVTELANGNIQIYDNGSSYMCVDPANRTGPRTGRISTRVTEYSLDEQAGTATLVWSYDPGRFALFAGSAARLPDGHTLVGWATHPAAMATEVAADGTVLWEMRDAQAGRDPDGPFYSSYRVMPFVVPDVVRPVVAVETPAADAEYRQGEVVTVDYTCTDTGGSTLRSCTSGAAAGSSLDTGVPGSHQLTVRAVDGDGNVRTVTRTYRVLAEHGADAAVRAVPGGAWVGADIVGGATGQTAVVRIARDGRTARAVVRLRSSGYAEDRLLVRGARSSRLFAVRYRYDGVDVTRKVVAGTWRTPTLDSGESVALEVRVTRARAASPGDTRLVSVRTESMGDPDARDTVAVRAKATR